MGASETATGSAAPGPHLAGPDVGSNPAGHAMPAGFAGSGPGSPQSTASGPAGSPAGRVGAALRRARRGEAGDAARHGEAGDAARLGEARDAARRVAGDVRRALRRALRVMTPLGRAVAAVAVVCWVAGSQLHWQELMVAAGGCLFLLVAGGALVARRSSLQVAVVLRPDRVVAGSPSAGQVTVTNSSSRRSGALQVELPVGQGLAVFDIPAIAAGASNDELFVVPTRHRGVIPVGPPTSLRSDPLGLFAREAVTGRGLELIVHPRTVALAPFGSGVLRDLEGLPTKDLSASDLAFHALREYAPGDDRRHVHWRSSAKAGRLLVRQFQDTRRSSLCIAVDSAADAYGDDTELETALEVAASLVVRACHDDLAIIMAVPGGSGRGRVAGPLLDVLARARLADSDPGVARQAARIAVGEPDVSFAIVVSGSARPPEQLERATAVFAPEVRVIGVRIVPGQPPGLRTAGRMAMVQVPVLSDLPAALAAEAAA